MTDSKVWVSTSTIDSILHPKDSSHKHARLGMHGSIGASSNDADPDSQTVNWG
eukprot:CAMPEP_0201930204 /NCGR_PEP_ID=MMETSP0903-20130614/24697_1 /ASSEMBLY_ACC=CAM_ASM_000552 /TAXON_ID=420261 /ORGANISM="Thalassiosira antarctica, Strain CCMP982" /LENGTH=52 /DNA_ID=CAMNT_0048469219 /DNA_START=9 /DNA_END=163 /DNA_ORIENTATION=+